MHKPAEAAFHDPAAREHDKACLSGVTLDDAVAHAVTGSMTTLVLRCLKAPSRIASRKLGHAALPASRASSVSRSCTEAGTTATASQVPSASTRATRLRPSTFLAASYPRGPRTGMHLTDCVSMMLRPRLGPAAHRAGRRSRSCSTGPPFSAEPASTRFQGGGPQCLSPGFALWAEPARLRAVSALRSGDPVRAAGAAAL